MSEDITSIEAEAGVSAFDFKPFVNVIVEFSAGKKSTRPRYRTIQLDPEQARVVGMMFLESAIEAERDASTVAGAKAMGLDLDTAGMLLQVIRDHRPRPNSAREEER